MTPSSSIREQALRAVVAALGSTGTPSSNVFRSRLDQVKQTDLPCFDVTPGEERIEDPGEYGDHGSITRVLPVTVRAILDAGVQPGLAVASDDSALDPFYVFAVQKLLGSDGTLGGLVLNVEEITGAVVFQPAGRDLIGLEMTFQITFATQRGDPTQKG